MSKTWALHRKRQKLIQRVAEVKGVGLDEATGWIKELEETV